MNAEKTRQLKIALESIDRWAKPRCPETIISEMLIQLEELRVLMFRVKHDVEVLVESVEND